jgi:hypothetical protein
MNAAHKLRALAAAMTLALPTLAACDSTGSGAGGGGGGDGGGGGTLSVAAPAPNSTVSTPFQLKVVTSVSLGTTETGRHHIHVWFDGNEDKYQILYGDTGQVGDVPAGSHTMTVSLRNANHSDAGPRVEVPITVGAGGAPSAGPVKSNDPYDY